MGIYMTIAVQNSFFFFLYKRPYFERIGPWKVQLVIVSFHVIFSDPAFTPKDDIDSGDEEHDSDQEDSDDGDSVTARDDDQLSDSGQSCFTNSFFKSHDFISSILILFRIWYSCFWYILMWNYN